MKPIALLFLIPSLAFAQAAATLSQQEAVAKYPALVQPGSAFNKAFVAKVQQAKAANDPLLSRDDWPMTIAKEVAKELKVTAVMPVLEAGGGLGKFVKMSVSQVAGNSFSLEGALIELTGIDRVVSTEVATGVYEVTIWGPDSTCLKSKVSGNVIDLVKGSARLFVSVSNPNKYGAGITIHGNFTTYEGLSTMPKAIWK